MNLRVIIQARMSSARLPGKVLKELRGKPLLQYLFERLERRFDRVDLIVVTSSDDCDRPIADFCRAFGMACYRGSLQDVASRFRDVVRHHHLDAFVRVSGDSPLLDSALVAEAIARFRQGRVDLVTNVFPRSYPKGQSVEVLSGAVFEAAYEEFVAPQDHEHVTPFFYRNSRRYRIQNIASGQDWSDLSLVVDTPEDFGRIARLMAACDRPHWSYGCEELVRLYRRLGLGENAA